jgi:hypothetical protein
MIAMMLLALAGVQDLPLVLEEDFEKGLDRWELLDAGAWRLGDGPTGKMLVQHRKSEYKPPVRSPFGLALLKDVKVGDFVLEAKCRSTVKDYGHRDLVLVFGYQDASHYYYSHLGKKTDDHANQVFIVNGADRKKISSRTTPGTNWTDGWHRVKVVRKAKEGRIEVYFDDLETPAQVAEDRTFGSGRVGVGSFDDLGEWDDLRLTGAP